MTHIDEINTTESLEKALARLDEIWSAKPGDGDWEERRALVEQIAEYEDQRVQIPPPDPVDAILFRMEQGGLRSKDLVSFIGSAPKVSEVLARKRGLSKEMIRRLHQGLGIPLASLLGVGTDVPEGFVRVDWVLPVDVVGNVTKGARMSGVSEESWVTRGLTAIASSTSALGAYTAKVQPSTLRTITSQTDCLTAA